MINVVDLLIDKMNNRTWYLSQLEPWYRKNIAIVICFGYADLPKGRLTPPISQKVDSNCITVA